MLENLLTGWKGKVLVLILLGFAATDFFITMTLSAADAATHAIENPFLTGYLGHHQVLVTLAFLTLLTVLFLRGFLGFHIRMEHQRNEVAFEVVEGDNHQFAGAWWAGA